jgi:hypothetical protein
VGTFAIQRSTEPEAPKGSTTVSETGLTTPTYLSAESFSFSGVTGATGIVVGLVAAITKTTPTALVVVIVAAAVGGMLLAIGLLDKTRDDQTAAGTAKQVFIALFNTAILAAAILGISSLPVIDKS